MDTLSQLPVSQLPLSLQLDDTADFNNFTQGDNAQLVTYLADFLTKTADAVCYLWGAAATGKSHLLQAICHLCVKQGVRFIYLPLRQLITLPTHVLENLEDYTLVVIDDMDALVDNPEWQEAIFHLYNRLQAKQHKLLCSANAAPHQLPLSLADLKSRLSAAVIFQVEPLTEDQKITALIARAHHRGIKLPTPVADYLLRHWQRDFANLILALEKLDTASLIEKRKLTIPFVKKVMGL